MTNSILTMTQVTKAALVVLHQKLRFIGSINRQYDDQFAQSGAKIGSQLKIRLPNRYTVRTGATFTPNDTQETSTTLTVATQKGVDTQFTSAELTLSMQDFTDRVLVPAMSVLAANIEADALSMVNDIWQTVDNTTNTSITMSTIMQARQKLVDALAPEDDSRTAMLNTQDNADLVVALKGLFQDSEAIKSQYREGMMGRTGGFDFVENTLLTNLTSGTMSAVNTFAVVDTLTPTTATSVLNVNNGVAGGATLVVGDVFTVTGLFRVHPESKASTGVEHQFVVTTPVPGGSTTTSISFSPPIVMAGASQNVISTAISTSLIKKVANTSRSLRQSLAFNRDAFAFVSADLWKPKAVEESAREVHEGISMRTVTFYTGSNDIAGTRIDVLYGYKTIRGELATKIWS